ncbi:MAG: InlB B-repeat-containing protein, partial [Planctomycetota bacterium]
GSQAVFENCHIVNNTVVDHTGAVEPNDPNDANDGPSGDYRQIPYSGYGGGMCLRDTLETIITGCDISNNEAGGGFGGALYSVGADFIVNSCNIVGNLAKKGGGLSSFDSRFDVNGCVIRANTAVDAGEGGGMYLFLTDAEVVDSIIEDNWAAWSGGGVYLTGDANSAGDVVETVVKNCLILHNSAGRDGGGISSNWYMRPAISNCTIFDNQVTGVRAYGGGLYGSYGTKVDVVDTIIWGNASSYEGSQIAVGSDDPGYALPSTVNISHSDIQPKLDPDPMAPTALDIVFCIDTSGSMADDIGDIQASVMQVTDFIADRIADFRIGVVDYQDFNTPNLDPNILIPYGSVDSYPFSTVLSFTNNVTTVAEAVATLAVSGEGDDAATVYSGLMHCIDHNAVVTALAPNEPNFYGVDPNSQGPGEWRGGSVSRMIILIGDAPPHDPEPYTEFTLGDVVSAARAKSINIYSIPIGADSETVGPFSTLAVLTGGEVTRVAEGGQVGEAVQAVVTLVMRTAPPIHVEDGCTLSGYLAESESWTSDSNNIGEDPQFVFGYYLSQIAAGQEVNSPCVDTGSGQVDEPDIGMHRYITRTDGVEDMGKVDMGYHYRRGFTWYRLTVTVLEDPCDPGIHGAVEPNSAIVYEGYGSNVVGLTAIPECNAPDYCYRVKQWTGTDNDGSKAHFNTVTVVADTNVTVEFELVPKYELTAVASEHGSLDIDPNLHSYLEGTVVTLQATAESGYRLQQWTGTDNDWSALNTNTVTMNGPRVVNVTFGLPRTITVGAGGNYATIQQGVDAARMGDRVLVYEGVYTAPYSYYYDPNTYDYYADTMTSGIDFRGKNITLRSSNPEATVIIDCQKTGRAFYFHSGEDANTVISNIIIRNGYVHGPVGTAGGYGGSELTDPNDPNSEPDPNAGTGGDAFGDARGGGIYCTNGSSPTFTNCTITNCLVAGAVGGMGGPGMHTIDEHGDGGAGGIGYGVGYGGAIACTADSNPTFIDCAIIRNRAVGGVAGLGGEGAVDITDSANNGI